MSPTIVANTFSIDSSRVVKKYITPSIIIPTITVKITFIHQILLLLFTTNIPVKYLFWCQSKPFYDNHSIKGAHDFINLVVLGYWEISNQYNKVFRFKPKISYNNTKQSITKLTVHVKLLCQKAIIAFFIKFFRELINIIVGRSLSLST